MARTRPAPRPPKNLAFGVHAPGRVGEGQRSVEVGVAGHDDQHDGDDHAAPEQVGHLGDRVDPPVEQRHRDDGEGHGDQVALQRRHVEEVTEIVGHPDHAGGHDQRRDQQRRPHEHERHEAAGGVLVGLAQERVGASGARHGRPELGPDQPVQQRDDRADDPAQDGLRTAHGRDDQRDRDERPDAHHLSHVQRGGREQPQGADEPAVRGDLRSTGLLTCAHSGYFRSSVSILIGIILINGASSPGLG